MHLPIRLRLTLAFACAMLLLTIGLGAFLYLRLGSALLDGIDLGLRSRAQGIAADLNDAGAEMKHTSGRLIDPDEAFAQVLDPSRASPIVASSSRIGGAPLVPLDLLGSVHEPTFLSRDVQSLEDPARLLVVPVGESASFVVVGATLSDRQEALDRLLVALSVGGPIWLVLICVAGWWLAGAALRPVEGLRREAAAISASEPGRRLAVPPTDDELARLASTLNEMLDRLQQTFERERRFVDDAAHELRTPLGVLKGELDLALSRARSAAELEQALRSASDETDRLARLAEDLLVLSRAAGGRLPLHRVDTEPTEIIERAVDAHRRRADASGVGLEVQVDAGPVSLDPARFRQALDNLVDNAIRHTPPGGSVRVIAERSDGHFTVSVSDPGPGFPVDFPGEAFEPFARRDHGGEGAGLGLAIVRAVAQAHGGTATAENLPGGGARVSLDLPA
jgi:two-component system, OmpR family, sensor kinase